MDVHRLESITLPAHTGELHRLGDLWAEKPVIVAFLRHFGCTFCRENGILLSKRYDEVLSKGADIIAIGTGNADYAAAFVQHDGIPFPVLIDEDGVAAQAAEVRSQNLLRLVTDRRMFAAGKAGRAAGTLPTSHKGQKIGKRVRQLAATFVMGPGPTVHFAHYAEHGGDHPHIDDVIGALPVAPAASS